MVLAKTSGACVPGNFGWLVNVGTTASPVDSYCPISGHVENQPDGFRTSLNDQGYLYDWQVYNRNLGGSGAGWLSVSLAVEPSPTANPQVSDYVDYSNTTTVNSWSALIQSDQYGNGNKINNSNQDGFESRTYVGYLRCGTDGTETVVAGDIKPMIQSFCWTERPESASTNEYETTGKHLTTPETYEWTPYNENEACSAYVCKKLVSENCNAVIGKSGRKRSIPLLSFWQPSPE
jgi:hypothetical protein